MQKQKTPTRGSPEVKKLKGYLGMDGQVYNSFEEYKRSTNNPSKEQKVVSQRTSKLVVLEDLVRKKVDKQLVYLK